MAKIENEPETAPACLAFEVVVSFDGLDRGSVFTQADDTWAAPYVAAGYLREVICEQGEGRQG